jgi:hypothetical protein
VADGHLGGPVDEVGQRGAPRVLLVRHPDRGHREGEHRTRRAEADRTRRGAHEDRAGHRVGGQAAGDDGLLRLGHQHRQRSPGCGVRGERADGGGVAHVGTSGHQREADLLRDGRAATEGRSLLGGRDQDGHRAADVQGLDHPSYVGPVEPARESRRRGRDRHPV